MKKNVSPMTAVSVVVGCVIGAGVFFKPYAIYQATGGGPGMGILAWIIGGLMSIFGALTFAEVAVMIPRTGGMVTYLSEAYGKKIGYLAGWMQVMIFYPSFLAGYGVKVGEELSQMTGIHMTMPVAILIILTLCAVNIHGTKRAGRMQTISTICKLIPLLVLIVFGLAHASTSAIFTPMTSNGVSPMNSLGTTLLAVLFAFEGWTNVGALAGEMKNPAKDLPKAIVGGVSIIMAVYLLINIAYLRVLPADQLMNLPSPALAVAEVLFGKWGGALIDIGIIISVIGAGNGFLLSGSRVAYALAEENELPGSTKLASLNKENVPAYSILLIGILACLYSLSGQFDLLTNLGVFSCWVFYTLTFSTIIWFRKKRPDLKRTYSVPCYPLVPWLAIVSGLYVILSQIFLSGSEARIMALFSIVITLAGLPVNRLYQKYCRK